MSQISLLKSKRFLPLFITQALGAFNDNVLKTAMVFLVTYRLFESQGWDPSKFTAIAAGLFILPFFLFSATAGELADKYPKDFLMRRIKFAEILLMIGAAIGFYFQNIPLLLVILFCMGTQSTFFGPLKYGILPQHLKEKELIGGNGLIEGATFLAILLGTMYGGFYILQDFDTGSFLISASLIGLALLGFIAVQFVPPAPAPSPDLKINWNLYSETKKIIALTAKRRDVWLSILGLSWFWFVGTIFISYVPIYAKSYLNGDARVTNLLLATFSIGIAIGSVLCNHLLKGRISAHFVPLAAVAMGVFGLDMVWATYAYNAHVPPLGANSASEHLFYISQYLNQKGSWRVLFDLFAISVAGGLYCVPLYAIIQGRSDPDAVSRTIAGNNIINAAFMVGATVISLGLLTAGLSVLTIFLITAILNCLVAIYICKLLPTEILKSIGRMIFKLFYRVEVKGMEHYDKVDGKAVLIANHVSYLDPAIIGSFLPDTPVFGVNTHVAQKWWMKPFLALFELLPLDPTSPMAVRTLVNEVKTGKKCVIFPEGRLTVTGALMKVYEGPGSIATLADAPIIPVRIDGAQYSFFSRLKGKLRLRWFPKITMTLLPPVKLEVDKKLSGRERRHIIGHKLYNLMTSMVFETSHVNQTLFQGLIEARHVHGGRFPILEDVQRSPLNYNKLVLGSFVLGRALNKKIKSDKPVGVLLPNANGAVVTFFGLQAFGHVPAMLNFSAGTRAMRLALETTEATTLVTSKRFIELGKLEDTIAELSKIVRVIYLEDIRENLSIIDKAYGLFARVFAKTWTRIKSKNINTDDPAVVLFTSGSEGTPKAVLLSHKNIHANRYQLSTTIDFNQSDKVFNCLPIFHAFGLTAACLLPIYSGVPLFLYPSPLHYRIVPELIYDTNATIMFGTDTFLRGYVKRAHPYDFYSVRYIFAGAEKLKAETAEAYIDKFGLRIFEGYGATETAPALSMNTPMHHKKGSVGRLLPGIDYKLEPVPGIDGGGRLIVKGPNIMAGYMFHKKPGVLSPPEDGWYDTGDIVEIDELGFITIKGRAKRFAKIAGEMVSLTMVEQIAGQVSKEESHAAAAIPDEKKGEQVILFTTDKKLTKAAFSKGVKAAGQSDLLTPKEIVHIKEIPLLGTGKTDYAGVNKLAKDYYNKEGK